MRGSYARRSTAAGKGKTRDFSTHHRGLLRGPYPGAVLLALSSPRELIGSILMKDGVLVDRGLHVLLQHGGPRHVGVINREVLLSFEGGNALCTRCKEPRNGPRIIGCKGSRS